MMAFAYGVGVAGDLAHQGWVQGLKVAAVAIVAQAVLGMARNLCPDRARAVLACVVAIVLTLFTAAWVQLAGIAGGAIAGHFFGHWFKLAPSSQNLTAAQPSRNLGIACLSLFTGLLVFLPCLGKVRPTAPILVFDEFYRAGALVFGGGHVVLPLLQKATVGRGWIDQNIFMTGYGAAQALPGPLFAFSSYLGVIMAPGGIYGGLLALTAIYLPAVLVLFGALPCWDRLRSGVWARSVLAGANAAVVGLLAAALYSPIWTTTVNSQSRFALAVASFAGLQLGRLPPWLVVGTCAGIGALAFG